jgi:hypothetical protein
MTKRTTAKGFGTPFRDGKARIAAKKHPDLYSESDSAQSHYFGSDTAVVPEFNSVAPESPTTSDSPNQTQVAVDTNTGMLQLSQAELNRLINNQATDLASSMNRSATEQLEATRQAADDQARRHADELSRLQGEIQATAADRDRLKAVFDATGTSIPNGDNSNRSRNYSLSVNTLILPSSMEPQGAAKDFVDAWSNPSYTPKAAVFDPNEGMQYEQRDTTYIDTMMKDASFRKHAIADMERLFKAHGYLRGADFGGRDGQAGPTLATPGSVANAFLPFLSTIMRLSHTPRYVWHQFASERLELGRVPGTTMMVPRIIWLDEPDDEMDYLLDSDTEATNISSESQALQSLSTPIKLFGYGLGKGNKVGNRPVAISEFITGSSMLDLIRALDTNLNQNYRSFEDMKIRRIYQETLSNIANIYYNEAGSLTQTPVSIGVGEDGTLTEEVLNSLAGEMTRRQIPTFPNGKRVGVINTFATTQLKNSLGDKLQAYSEAQIQEITGILNAGTLGNGTERLSGYVGDYCGFMLFESGTISVGPASIDPLKGVNTITLGVGPRTVRDNYFFGPGVAGHGESLPMEIRMDGAGQFDTRMRFIWRSIEGWGPLDCSSIGPSGPRPEQQDRVLCLRTTDQPV